MVNIRSLLKVIKINNFMQEEIVVTDEVIENEVVETTPEDTAVIAPTGDCTNCSPEVTDCSVCEKGAVVEGQL